MAYASFRCQVKAPLATVWQLLRAKVQPLEGSGAKIEGALRLPPGSSLREEILIDSGQNRIIVRLLAGQALQGERKFAVKSQSGESSAVLETILHWRAASADLDRQLMESAVDVLVRDLALEIKSESESFPEFMAG